MRIAAARRLLSARLDRDIAVQACFSIIRSEQEDSQNKNGMIGFHPSDNTWLLCTRMGRRPVYITTLSNENPICRGDRRAITASTVAEESLPVWTKRPSR